MPVIKSAKKKLKQDKKRTIERAKVEAVVKDAIRNAVAAKTVKAVRDAVSMIDKAAKKHIFHKNRAARIKSRLAHLLSPKGTTKTAVAPATKKVVKKTVKKTSAKK